MTCTTRGTAAATPHTHTLTLVPQRHPHIMPVNPLLQLDQAHCLHQPGRGLLRQGDHVLEVREQLVLEPLYYRLQVGGQREGWIEVASECSAV